MSTLFSIDKCFGIDNTTSVAGLIPACCSVRSRPHTNCLLAGEAVSAQALYYSRPWPGPRATRPLQACRGLKQTAAETTADECLDERVGSL